MGIEILTVSNEGEVTSHGIVLNPLTNRQLVIAARVERPFIHQCLQSLPEELPVYRHDLVLPSGKTISVDDYCAAEGIDPLQFVANYEVGKTKPVFADNPTIEKVVRPGDKDFNLAVTRYFSGVRVSGFSVYAGLVLTLWQK